MMRRGIYAIALFGACGLGVQAQTLLQLPEASPRAVVMQRIGVTDVTVVYHRPMVNNRKIWGGIVPYDQVWRAGANENTTIEFSDTVMVEGKPLPKGVYGLHMIPGAENWTVAFSKTSSAWGSFTYDAKEDALRVSVKAVPAEFHEALTYTVDDLKPESAVIALSWEKLKIPFQVSVAQDQIFSSIRSQLRGGSQYYWEGFYEAASYALSTKTNLEEGLTWADRSIAAEERFDNHIIKSKLLEASNRTADAQAAKERAMQLATVLQLYFYGRQLQTQKHPEEAMEFFQATAKRFPDHWLGHMSQARIASAKGDYDKALQEVKTVQTMPVPEQQKANLVNLAKRLENKEDINR